MKKVAVVTGANSEIGREVILRLSKADYIVYALSKQKVEYGYQNIIALTLDITNSDACEKLVSKISQKEKTVDVLVNIAGYTISGPSLGFSESDFRDIVNVNLFGAFRLIKNIYPLMKINGGGKIVNITSLNGLISLPNFGLYSASKHALEALGNALYYELYKDKIFVINIIPGAIKKTGENTTVLHHKPAREKFLILKLLFPMLTPDYVAAKIITLINKSNPLPILIIGADAKIMILLKNVLPQFLWVRLMRFIWEK